jgi:hypothetical protein
MACIMVEARKKARPFATLCMRHLRRTIRMRDSKL